MLSITKKLIPILAIDFLVGIIKCGYDNMNNINLAYCDYLAYTVIYPSLEYDQYREGIVKELSHIKIDEKTKEGFIPSSTRIIELTDRNDKKYKITIEEIT